MRVRVGLSCSRCGAAMRPSARGWQCPTITCEPVAGAEKLPFRGPRVKALTADPWQLFN